MATKRTDDPRIRMIHCEYCGEDYASSYKHCPFCDEMDADNDEYYDDEEPRPRAGKRLAGSGGGRGGGYNRGPSPLNIVFTVLSLALIVAAVIIVISIIRPLVQRGETKLPQGSPVPTPTLAPTPTPPAGSATPAPDGSTAPDTSPAPGASPLPVITPPISTPAPVVSGGQATSFSLNKSEFTISDRWPEPITLRVTFFPDGSSGTVTWTSSNSEVASVDSSGKVSHGSKQGTATITATLSNGVTQTCKVHNTCSGSGGSTTTTTTPSGNTGSSSLSLSRTDFTLKPGESYRVRVSGNSGTPTWSIGNTAVATVSGDGNVTYVGSGSTTLTCTVDGQTLTCIVRCSKS